MFYQNVLFLRSMSLEGFNCSSQQGTGDVVVPFRYQNTETHAFCTRNGVEIVFGLILELRRGTLILLVLSQLRQPTYGYSLVKKLNDNAIPMDANTLYPLMRRLEGQGLLKSQWDTGESKPRKYYQTTAEGLAVLEKTKSYWQTFSASVDALLEEEL